MIEIPRLTPRQLQGHKGDYGKVLVVGGSRGMIGAPALAALGALRGGAGLVMIAAPRIVQLHVAGLAPCATSIALDCDQAGHPVTAAVGQVVDAASKCDVIAVGPGMEVGETQCQMLRALLVQPLPLVIDADGLNNLAQMGDWPAQRNAPVVVTPHPGEFSRLTGKGIQEIQEDRERIAETTARRWAAQAAAPLVLVLKGAGTVVCDGQSRFVNQTGNPGMASGGAGDVLTGLIAALIGQGLSPRDAAVLGVAAHGRAGDLAAEERGQISLIATDLLDFLPAALRQYTA
jgi:NAD(P)H-hydrate epimerase